LAQRFCDDRDFSATASPTQSNTNIALIRANQQPERHWFQY